MAIAVTTLYLSPMGKMDVRAVYEAVSRGEISRPEAARRLGIDLPFGDMLLELRRLGLTLPRFPSDPNSPGVRLVTELASQGDRVGRR